MNEKLIDTGLVTKENSERGRNTEVKLIFVRHSQKNSGAVFDGDTTHLSKSSISPNGIRRAAEWGQKVLMGLPPTKAYSTFSERTKETILAAGVDPKKIQNMQSREAPFAFPESKESDEIAKKYRERFAVERNAYLQAHFPGRAFDSLSSDEQEEVAEHAEEPVIQWYLSFGDQRPDVETPSTREHAASVAFKVNRLIHLADFMPNGKSIELVSAGHKTSTEAFLQFVLVRRMDGIRKTGLDDLSEIGGSMKILDGWELHIHNDLNGEKTVSLIIRRESGTTQAHEVDVEMIQKLAHEYIHQSTV